MTSQVNGQSLEWLEPQTPNQIMDEAIKVYELDSLYVLFSGGKDSVCVADFIAKNYPKQFKGVVFTNVGLGAQETRKFVIDYCKEKGWKLFLTWNVDEKRRFFNIVMREGFAYQGNHRQWMGMVKFQTWYYFMRDYVKPLGESAAFISGVRKKESFRRNKISKFTKKPIDISADLIFIKPFLYKNGSQLWDYFIENKLKKTPVYEWLNRSGECYCGAFAEPWDLKLMETHDPLAYNTIKWMEKQIEIRGSNKAKKYNKWGYKESTLDVQNQTQLETFTARDGELVEVIDDYCGESCQVIN